MKIKINKQIEAGLLVCSALVAGAATYSETNRLAGHFMQRKTTEVVSYTAPIRPVAIVPTPTTEAPSPIETPAPPVMPTEKPSTPKPSAPTPEPEPQPKREPIVTRSAPTSTPEARPTVRHLRRSAPDNTPEVKPVADFPAFERAIYPVNKAPDWGNMTSKEEWERIYAEMTADDFVTIPAYNVSELTIPMNQLTRNRTAANNAIITAKLFYSTRFFGAYDLDSSEHEGRHVGIDFKLAAGTPIGAIAGGVVHATGSNDDIGNYVMVLHQLPNTSEEVVSVYGHLDSVTVTEGRAVAPGTIIGYAGSTGKSRSPHLHLQIDYKKNPGRHRLYVPGSDVSISETSKWTIHPIEFIAKW